MTYTVIQGNKTLIENATIKQFIEYIQDTDDYQDWLTVKDYTQHYGKKLFEHFLSIYDKCIQSYLSGFFWLDYEFYPELDSE